MLLLAQKILDNLHAASLGIPLVKGNSRTERQATLCRITNSWTKRETEELGASIETRVPAVWC